MRCSVSENKAMFIIDDVVKIVVKGVAAIMDKILAVRSSSNVRRAHMDKPTRTPSPRRGRDHVSH